MERKEEKNGGEGSSVVSVCALASAGALRRRATVKGRMKKELLQGQSTDSACIYKTNENQPLSGEGGRRSKPAFV